MQKRSDTVQKPQNVKQLKVSMKHLAAWNMNVVNVHLYLNSCDQLSVCSYWKWSV